MGKFTVSDNAANSNVSTGEAAAAEHQARDDASASGSFERGDSSKNSERFSSSDSSGQAASGFWASIFGK